MCEVDLRSISTCSVAGGHVTVWLIDWYLIRWKSYTFSGNVDDRLRNRRLTLGDVLTSKGTVTFDLYKNRTSFDP